MDADKACFQMVTPWNRAQFGSCRKMMCSPDQHDVGTLSMPVWGQHPLQGCQMRAAPIHLSMLLHNMEVLTPQDAARSTSTECHGILLESKDASSAWGCKHGTQSLRSKVGPYRLLWSGRIHV